MKALNPSMAMAKLDPKIIKYGAIFIGGVVLFFIVKGQVKKLIDRPYGARAQAQELKDVIVKDYNVTISPTEAVLITQNLFNAMNRTGTDEQSIIRNLEQLKTKDDLLLIIKKFGIKPYNGSGLTVTEIRKKLWSRDLNLSGWIAAELSGGFDIITRLKNAKYRKQVVVIYENLGVNF